MVTMGVISNLPRVKNPPRTRRANSRIGLTDPDQVVVTGQMTTQIAVGTASANMPANPVNGQTVLLTDAESAGPALCVFYGSSWHVATTTELS